MGKIRDYSAATIQEFERYMDEYYDDSGKHIRSSWDSFCHWVRTWFKKSLPIEDESAEGNAEKYIKSLTKEREATENKIRHVWEAVKRVEEEYSGKYESIASMSDSYCEILGKVSNIINISSITNPATFTSLMNECADDYMALIETKVNDILDKPLDQLTDGDIEILAYIALNTTDDQLKERIYNKFYVDKSSDHIHYSGNGPQNEFHYFERDEEKWKKFTDCTEYYYESAMVEYYNDNITDEEFNKYIRNYSLMNYLDSNAPDCVTYNDDMTPVDIDDHGKVSFNEPDKEQYFIISTEQKTNNNPDLFNTQDVANQAGSHRKSYESDLLILDGTSAESEIKYSIKDKLYDDSSAMEEIIEKTIKKGIPAVADVIVPGSGEVIKVIEKGVKVVDNVVDTVQTIDDAANKNAPGYVEDYKKGDYADFVSDFEMKCVITGDSYTLIPSNKSMEIAQKMLDWMKQNHSEVYQLLVPLCPEGTSEAMWFLNNVSPHEFYSIVEGAGIDDDLHNANILH